MNWYKYSFIGFARCLGVGYFKKYWTVGGSVWNINHINKNYISDLQSVIDDAHEYTRYHIRPFVVTLILSGTFLCVDFQNKNATLAACGCLLFFELYAFMVHHYNRILASDRIEYLKSQGLGIKPEKKFENTFADLIVQKHDFFYVVKCEHPYFLIGPKFRTEELANDYREQLINSFDTPYDLYMEIYRDEFLHSNPNHVSRIPFPNKY